MSIKLHFIILLSSHIYCASFDKQCEANKCAPYLYSYRRGSSKFVCSKIGLQFQIVMFWHNICRQALKLTSFRHGVWFSLRKIIDNTDVWLHFCRQIARYQILNQQIIIGVAQKITIIIINEMPSAVVWILPFADAAPVKISNNSTTYFNTE